MEVIGPVMFALVGLASVGIILMLLIMMAIVVVTEIRRGS